MARNRRNTRGSGNSKNLDSKGIRFLQKLKIILF